MMQLLRSWVFFFYMYGLLGVWGIACVPLALWSREGAQWSMHVYVRMLLPGLRLLTGLRTEIRGPVPTGPVVVSAKHQSFLDIILLFGALDNPRFVMKRSILWMPVLGFYAMRIGCAAVERKGRPGEVGAMVERSAATQSEQGQIIIYPQGTRVAPGASMPYKTGVYALAEGLGVPIHPAATNAGLFWARRGVLRKPGLAVVEFLPPMEGGMRRKPMVALMGERIEAASNALMAEARAADPTL
ncbi:MAG: 1-acyl-sn-glycerol-3-phosphate acyltransferase [Paracoccaceae bacterium]|jgi:1-acyl-sn-glycerol-3-phosphate acyltransferase